MEKIKVILVVLDKKFLRNSLAILNYNRAIPFAVLMDGDENFVTLNNKVKIQIVSFAALNQLLELGKNFLWLICGKRSEEDLPAKLKKFLMANDVSENNIINFEVIEPVNPTWLANLRFVEENPIDYFATGDDLIMCGMNFKLLPEIKGVNLASVNQDLRRSFLTAQYVFKKVKHGTIKFVFIGLAPYSLCRDNRKNFSTCADDFAYNIALNEKTVPISIHDKLLASLLSDKAQKIFSIITSERADLNYNNFKAMRNKKITISDMTSWEEELTRLTKNFDAEIVENNLHILEEYVKLCLDNGAKPIAILFPFATVLRENYNREILMVLRRELHQLEKLYYFTFIDMFSAQIGYDCFSDMTHLNLNGATLASSAIDLRLRGKEFLSIDKVSRVNYATIFNASNFLSKEDFNETLSKHFKLIVRTIRNKKKIRVGFVSDDPSVWCGDYLFNLFANDRRCETTFFLCLQKSLRDQALIVEDFNHGFESFKSRGINVVAITNNEDIVPAQDLLIMLRPYFHYLPKAFSLSSTSAETLLIYIPYGFNTSIWNVCDTPLHRFGWKLFLESREHIEIIEEKCRDGAPRCFYSGYPKLDAFYKNHEELQFVWKTTRPDAKKIIYAPHWSINSGLLYATFQWNYQFMYEFAKAHPETSWVLKPHPLLLASAVGHKVFSSNEDFKEYLQAWEKLPNAKIFTGSEYQGLFATSDVMIMDCGSWIGEYQYTHKPLIFLTRNTQKFNKLGNELMKVLYRVDGKDLKGISALLQKVLIEGKDELFEARQKFFNEHMDYINSNGITASEFIFNAISKELRL